MMEHELGMCVLSHLELTRFKTIRWHFAATAGFSSQSKIRSARRPWIRIEIPESLLSLDFNGTELATTFNPTDNSISHFDCLYMSVR